LIFLHKFSRGSVAWRMKPGPASNVTEPGMSSPSDPPANNRPLDGGAPPFASIAGDDPPRRFGLFDFLMAPFRDIDERAHYAPGNQRRAKRDGNGHAPNGHAPNGHAHNGHAVNGHARNGAANGHAANGHAANGRAPNGRRLFER
jgi:hypothetical protein